MATAALNAAPVGDDANPLWQRMAGLRLRLGDGVSVHPLSYRGQTWYVLRDAFSRQQLRLSAALYRWVTRLDGRRTLAEALSDAAPSASGAAAVNDETLAALTRLHAAGMLASEQGVDLASLLARHGEVRRQRRMARWLRPLSPRFPLLQPDRFLQRSLPLVRWMLHPLALLLGLALLGYAGVEALRHWDALAVFGAQRLDDPQQWLLLVCAYPLVKALHELGHGYAARARGAEVNEMGVTLLVFLPVPYVDASAASVLPARRDRMLVGAAGILVELLLAAIALFAWIWLDDGIGRDIAFAVMVIGGVSTLLFNGNPLLRFDGYYVLSDAIEIPNLATRAARFYGYLVKRHLLGIGGERPPACAPGERPWFLFYAPAAFLYRLAISVAIALFLVATIPFVGAVLAAWLLAAQLLLPLLRQLRFLATDPALAGRRVRAVGMAGGVVLTVFAALALVPVPSSTHVDGIVMLPEQSVVRAGVEGFLERRLVEDGETVAAGQPLFRLRNAELDSEVAELGARLVELQLTRDALRIDDRLEREIQADRLADVREELAELRARQAGLEVRSPAAGVFMSSAAPDRLGRLVEQGEMLAFLAEPAEDVVRAVASQADAGRIRAGVEGITVRLADRDAPPLKARLLHEVPLGTETLPSASLGSRGGGRIAVDARDERGVTALQPVFTFDLAIPGTRAGQYIGSRAFVRFEHAPAALLPRWYDVLRRRVIDEIGE